TSHDVVQRLRKLLDQRRIRHTGTLDPLAQGLLVVCLGSATKIVRFLTGWDKTYEADIVLGRSSKTFDGEGIDDSEPHQTPPELTKSEIEKLLDQFRGRIVQRVPAYSGVRIGGQRLYDLARRGTDVTPPSREVEIKSLRCLSYDSPHLILSVTCSKGTYIRSLANDLGEAIGCGAYLAGLVRQSVGGLHLEDSLSLDQIDRWHTEGKLGDCLLPCHRVLDFAAIRVTDDFRRRVLDGCDLSQADVMCIDGSFEAGDTILLKDREGTVLAVGTAEVPSHAFGCTDGNSLFEYVRVLN
ncbi:MAG: tRNA pseudouridine(55) synthase TruB, partial [candidate division Zixibacteria bacterium]|nr:tRNA pseudouridine(55) synthase TruB [candidate division Zixibacteria bacterium]